jgi:cytochrome c biogenesis protein CcdA/peroxiredoxin
MLLLLVAFIAGVLTVLAPCILPLLPVIIGGSLTGEGREVQKKKVLTIIISLGLSVIVFTLLLKASTLFINVPESAWKWLSGGIILVFGIVTLFPSLWSGKWLARLSTKSNILLGEGNKKNNFFGDVIIGAALGPVFSTCSPTYFLVLATVLPAQPIVGLGYLLVYTAGLCLSLFMIAFIGQRIMTKLNIAANPNGWFKRALAVLFILVGIAIISGYDKKIEFMILNNGLFDITKVEFKLLEYIDPPKETSTPISVAPVIEEVQNLDDVPPTETSVSLPKEVPQTVSTEPKKVAPTPPPVVAPQKIVAPKPVSNKPPRPTIVNTPFIELVRPNAYLNTGGQPITIAEQLPDKLVLVTFITYSCINCQRTFSYLQDWHEKYADDGLVIIGVHSPEFAFEHKEEAVQKALDGHGITFPVVLDNDRQTWRAYGNRFWPRRYLIGPDGTIVFDHIGEGAYAETESLIQEYLGIN